MKLDGWKLRKSFCRVLLTSLQKATSTINVNSVTLVNKVKLKPWTKIKFTNEQEKMHNLHIQICVISLYFIIIQLSFIIMFNTHKRKQLISIGSITEERGHSF